MKRLVFSIIAAAALAISSVSVVAADAPPRPGCFGTDRAAFFHQMMDVGGPGGSGTGMILAGRAGTNPVHNQAYLVACGQTPE